MPGSCPKVELLWEPASFQNSSVPKVRAAALKQGYLIELSSDFCGACPRLGLQLSTLKCGLSQTPQTMAQSNFSDHHHWHSMAKTSCEVKLSPVI